MGDQIRVPKRTHERAEELSDLAGTKPGDVLEDSLNLMNNHLEMIGKGYELFYRNPSTGQETRIVLLGCEKYLNKKSS